MFITHNIKDYIQTELRTYFGTSISSAMVERIAELYPIGLQKEHGSLPPAFKAWVVLQIENDTGKCLQYDPDVGLYICSITDLPIQDLTDLQFSFNIGTGSGYGGSLLKAYADNTYYKASYMSGSIVIGFESIYECIVSDLLDQLHFNHVGYTLHHAKIKLDGKVILTDICSSLSFRQPGYDRVTLETLANLNGVDVNDKEELLNFVLSLDDTTINQMWQMMIADYVCYNRDRHTANIEFLQNNYSTILAPIFDCGASFFAPQQSDLDTIKKFNLLADGPVNGCLGSMFYEDALRLWPPRLQIPDVRLSGEFLSKYENSFPDKSYITYIWNMIKQRWRRLHEIRG